MLNPFILTPYISKELFCDRIFEIKSMMNFISNGVNITLISPRRYGKTGLIYRTFDELKMSNSEFDTLYVDIYSSQSIEDFIRLLTEAVVRVLEKKSMVKNFFGKLKSVRPIISYDPITGIPQITLTWQSEQEKLMTLKEIFDFLDCQKHRIVLAIDEFQQIREYENVNMEALLRTYIQPLKNVNFIFCGSKRHLMLEMFADAKSPFYESTATLFLDKIDREIYADFIITQFKKGKIQISDEAVEHILNWTRQHTFYTQFLCNRLFSSGKSKINLNEVLLTENQILTEREPGFLELRGLLTKGQWKYLRAVAKEKELRQPSSSAFLTTYKIGSAASSQKTLKSLIEKELILPVTTLDGTIYCIYNVFFFRWLEKH